MVSFHDLFRHLVLIDTLMTVGFLKVVANGDSRPIVLSNIDGCGYPGSHLSSKIAIQLPISTVLNGTILDSRNANRTFFPVPVGSRAVHSCEEPYIILGDVIRICLTNSSWSGTAPYCGLNVAMNRRIVLPADRFAWLTNDGVVSIRSRDCYAHSTQAGSRMTWKLDLAEAYQIHSLRILALADFTWSANVTVQSLLRSGSLTDHFCGGITYTGSDQTAAVSVSCGVIAPVRWIQVDFSFGNANGRFRLCEVNVLAVDAIAPELCPQRDASARAVVNGSCLTFHGHGRTTWSGAAESCRKLGGALVSDVHQDQQAFLRSKLQYLHRFQPTEAFYWIGLTRSINLTSGDDRWTWNNGLSSSSSFWAPNQPDKPSSKQFCAALSGKSGWLWNDFNCNSGQGFWICQMNITSCPFPDQPTNGFVMKLDRRLDGLVNYGCEEGFQVIGSVSRSCQTSGKWSGLLPQCRRAGLLLSVNESITVYQLPPVIAASSPILPVSWANDMTSAKINSSAAGVITGSTEKPLGHTTTNSGIALSTSMAAISGTRRFTDVPPSTTTSLPVFLPGTSPLPTAVSTTSHLTANVTLPSTQTATVDFANISSVFTLFKNATDVSENSTGLFNSAPSMAATTGSLLTSPAGISSMRCRQVPYLLNGQHTMEMLGPILVARYSCHPGFNLVGLPFLTCALDGSWRGIEPLCIPWFGVTPPPFTVSMTPEQKATVTFPGTFTRASNSSVSNFATTPTATPNMNLTETTVTVARPTTNSIPTRAATVGNASKSDVDVNVRTDTTLISSRSVTGTSVSIVTSTTETTTNATLLSTKVGVALVSNASERSTSCSDVPMIPFGETLVQGRQAMFRCFPGYVLVGNNVTRCMPNEIWDTVPQCREIDCGQPEKFPDSTVVLLNGTNTYGSTVMYTCSRLAAQTVFYRTCSSQGQWVGPYPECFLELSLIPAESRQNVQQSSAGFMTIMTSVVGSIGAVTVIVAVIFSVRWLRRRDSATTSTTSPTMYSLSDDHTSGPIMTERRTISPNNDDNHGNIPSINRNVTSSVHSGSSIDDSSLSHEERRLPAKKGSSENKPELVRVNRITLR